MIAVRLHPKNRLLRRLLPTLVPILVGALLGAVVAAEAAAAENDPLSGAMNPAELLQTLAEAAATGDRITYLGGLADTFVYIPLPSDVVNNRTVVWSGWNRAREVAFVDRAFDFGDMDFPRVIEVHSRTHRTSDHAEWDVTYEIGGAYRARAVFGMVRNGQRWYLWRWEDIAQVFNDAGQVLRGSAEWRATIVR